jgi:hypothetical protein
MNYKGVMELTERITKKEWVAKGTQLFGENVQQWQFVCPGCGHVQKITDFKPFKNQGATPGSVYSECIGRYTGGKSWANSKDLKGGPCDYAAYGLLNICPVIVVDDDGKEIKAFAFNEAGK